MNWTQEEKDHFMGFVLAQDCDTLKENIEYASDLMEENGWTKRTISAYTSMFYNVCKTKRLNNHSL